MAVVLSVPVLVAGSGNAASARSALVDPAEALKQQLVEKRGVKISRDFTSTMERKDGSSVLRTIYHDRGVAEFGSGKVVATDTRPEPGAFDGSGRLIVFAGREYFQQKSAAQDEDKSWTLRKDKRIRPSVDSTGIDIADPAVLKALLATAETKRPAGVYDGTRTTLYQGTLTFAELYKIYPEFFEFEYNGKPRGQQAKTELSWRLWLGRDRLVRRSWASWIKSHGDVIFTRCVTDIRLTRWGTEVDITPPPQDEVKEE